MNSNTLKSPNLDSHDSKAAVGAAVGAQTWPTPCTETNAAAENSLQLHKLAQSGDLKKIRLLIQEGADPNLCLPHLGTPLHRAVLGNQREVVAFLVEDQKVEIDSFGGAPLSTSLHWACKTNHAQIAKYLISRGAN
eukprot:Sdes_comp25536_c0_seq1m22800